MKSISPQTNASPATTGLNALDLSARYSAFLCAGGRGSFASFAANAGASAPVLYRQYHEGRGYVWEAGKPTGLASDQIREDGGRFSIYCDAGYIGWEATLSEAIMHWNRWSIADTAFCQAHDC